MSTRPSKAIPASGLPPSPGLDKEEPEFRHEADIPTTQQEPAAEGAFDTDTVRPEDQSDG